MILKKVFLLFLISLPLNTYSKPNKIIAALAIGIAALGTIVFLNSYFKEKTDSNNKKLEEDITDSEFDFSDDEFDVIYEAKEEDSILGANPLDCLSAEQRKIFNEGQGTIRLVDGRLIIEAFRKNQS